MARTKQTKNRKNKGGAPAASASVAKAKKQQVSKHKKPGGGSKKKNSSNYGPISVQQPQQPKGTKWTLPASMGGKNVKRKSKKKSPNSKTNNKTSSSSKTTKKFNLNMPVVSRLLPVVPWLTMTHQGEGNDHHHPQSSNSKATVRLVHKCLSFNAASLENLNTELERFSNYVRLNETEIASRRSVVEQIQAQCRQLFGVPPQSCQVFGSFASLSVCTFTSDVDMAIHNVVQAPPGEQTFVSENHHHQQEQVIVDDNDTTPKRETKRMKTEPLPPHPNLKRQDRVLKWKALFEEAEEKKQEVEEQSSSDVNKDDTASNKGATSTSTSTAIEGTSAAFPITIADETTSGRRQELAESTPLPSSAESNQEGLPLFVIDRAGCPEEDSGIVKAGPAQTAGTITTTDAPTVTDDTSRDASILDEEDESDPTVEAEGTEFNPSKAKPAAKRLEESGDEDSVRQLENNSYDSDESDADSADKLTALKDRKKSPDHSIRAGFLHQDAEYVAAQEEESDQDEDDEGEQDEKLKTEDEKLKTESRPRSRSIISLCSATTCSDTEEKEWDDSGMEVSFVSNRTSSFRKAETAAPIGPTGETRVKVVRALNSLSRRLRGKGLADQIFVRKWAKVPIINMETRFGYECDIAIGGHNGTDTSSYASSQCLRFKSFPTVVLILKILLNQHDLDKPFTGGLGSFKLYVLVASHIEQHVQLGGNDSPAEIFVTFLFRYGQVPLKLNGLGSKLMTHLTQNKVIKTGGQGFSKGMADMGGVYQLDNCIRVFQACFLKLRDKLQRVNTDAEHSTLGYIIDSKWLRKERQKCQQKLPPLSSHRNSGPQDAVRPPPGLVPFNWSENTSPSSAQKAREAIAGSKRKSEVTLKSRRAPITLSKQSGQKRSSPPINATSRDDDSVDTDGEAEQLKAGYGLGITPGHQTPPSAQARSPVKKRGTPPRGSRGRKKHKRA